MFPGPRVSRKDRRVKVAVPGMGLFLVELLHGQQVANTYVVLPSQEYALLTWKRKRLVATIVEPDEVEERKKLSLLPVRYDLPQYVH